MRKIIREIAYAFDVRIIWPIARYGIDKGETFAAFLRNTYPEKFKKEIEFLKEKK